MIRTQIQLEESQVLILKKMAAANHTSMAELIRQAVDFFARSKHMGQDSELRQRAMGVSGRFSSGVKDLSAEHDAYLAEAFEE
ncbi:ribbon-helix-helix domain-containing protein [Geobacter grbiciae]|uniref:ribbon-helix-helix domain-containing protein n=1 Tax=Geobacter grbiciae TaxID=155042 RepID=UPI001C01D3A2|nr:ribbon-helix-helix domain-containing protein [Geobacter grbiciae]MBT1075479.1 ribbon-helix-helix protein, CopG family [Geobacter grbiciae]